MRPEKTIAELFGRTHAQNIKPQDVYGIITDWAEVLVDLIGYLEQTLLDAQAKRQPIPPTEREKHLSLARAILDAFSEDLAVLYDNYKNHWRPVFTADAGEIQTHLHECRDALTSRLHLNINLQVIHHAAVSNILHLVEERAQQFQNLTDRKEREAFEAKRARALAKDRTVAKTLELLTV